MLSSNFLSTQTTKTLHLLEPTILSDGQECSSQVTQNTWRSAAVSVDDSELFSACHNTQIASEEVSHAQNAECVLFGVHVTGREVRASEWAAGKAGKGFGSREAEGYFEVEAGKDVVADGAAGSEECEVVVTDVVDDVIVQSGVDVQGALTSPLSDFIDM